MGTYPLTSPKLWRPLESWPFRQHIDPYIASMRGQHFGTRHIYHAVRAIGEFARWLTDDHSDGSDVHECTVGSFLSWRRRQADYRDGSPIALARFVRVLRDAGAIAPPSPSFNPRDPLLEAYRVFLEHGRRLKAKSSASYIWFARPFVRELWAEGEGLAALTRADVIAYIECHAPRRTPLPRRSCAAGFGRSSDI